MWLSRCRCACRRVRSRPAAAMWCPRASATIEAQWPPASCGRCLRAARQLQPTAANCRGSPPTGRRAHVLRAASAPRRQQTLGAVGAPARAGRASQRQSAPAAPGSARQQRPLSWCKQTRSLRPPPMRAPIVRSCRGLREATTSRVVGVKFVTCWSLVAQPQRHKPQPAARRPPQPTTTTSGPGEANAPARPAHSNSQNNSSLRISDAPRTI